MYKKHEPSGANVAMLVDDERLSLGIAPNLCELRLPRKVDQLDHPS
jgi:hypothetical protein